MRGDRGRGDGERVGDDLVTGVSLTARTPQADHPVRMVILKRWAVDEAVPGTNRAVQVCRHWTLRGADHCVRARMHTDLEAHAFVRGPRWGRRKRARR